MTLHLRAVEAKPIVRTSFVNKVLVVTIVVVFSMNPVLLTLSALHLATLQNAFRTVFYLFFGAAFLVIIKKKFDTFIILFTFICGGIIAASLLWKPENILAVQSMLLTICLQVFYVWIAYSIEGTLMYKAAKVASFINLGFAVISLLFFHDQILSSASYMAFSGYIMLPAAFFMLAGVTEKKTLYVLLSIAAMLIILLWGARSHLLYSILAIPLSLLMKNDGQNRRSRYQKIIAYALVVIVILYAMFHGNIENYLLNHGTESRTLSLLLSGDITSLSGREEAYMAAWNSIKQEPLFGNGVGSSHVLARTVWHTRDYNQTIHSGIVAVALEFGLIVAAVFVYAHLKALLRCLNGRIKNETKCVLLTLFAIGVIRALLGADYYIVESFALFWGLYFRSFRTMNTRRKGL